MKKTYIVCFFIAFIAMTNCFGQSIEISPSTLSIKEGDSGDVKIVVKNKKEGSDKIYWIGVSLSGDIDSEDFVFKLGNTTHNFSARLPVTIKANEEKEQISLSINPIKDGKIELLEKATIQFKLFIAETGGTEVSSSKLEAQIISDEKPTSDQLSSTIAEYYPSIDDINIFLGGSLKINDQIIFDSFAFEFFFRNPQVITLKTGHKFGIFAGIFNYTYSMGDSTINVNSITRQQNPSDPLKVGTKYIRETYSHNFNVAMSSLGAYVDFVWSTPKSTDAFLMGLSFHLEVMNSNTKYTRTRNLVRTDSLVYAQADSIRGLAVQRYAPIFLDVVHKRKTNGFFGFGLPITVAKEKKYEFYFHPTFGITTFTPANYRFNSPDFVSVHESYNTFYPFYLFRAQVSEKATGLGITLGSEVRGIFDNDNFYDPSFVLFVASKINISKLVGK